MNKSSRLEQQGLDYQYSICSIILLTSTNYVKIIALGPKMPPGVTCFTKAYIGVMWKSLLV